MKTSHLTTKIMLDETGEFTTTQMDELIDRALELLRPSPNFARPQAISVAVYEMPNYRTGRYEKYLTVVAQGED